MQKFLFLFLLIYITFLISLDVYAENKYEVVLETKDVIDGDTIKNVDVYLPFGLVKVVTVRLKGIDAPEMKYMTIDAATQTRDWLRNKVKSCEDLKASVHGSGSFGRSLVVLYCGDENVNETMLKKGLVKVYK